MKKGSYKGKIRWLMIRGRVEKYLTDEFLPRIAALSYEYAYQLVRYCRAIASFHRMVSWIDSERDVYEAYDIRRRVDDRNRCQNNSVSRRQSDYTAAPVFQEEPIDSLVARPEPCFHANRIRQSLPALVLRRYSPAVGEAFDYAIFMIFENSWFSRKYRSPSVNFCIIERTDEQENHASLRVRVITWSRNHRIITGGTGSLQINDRPRGGRETDARARR